MYVIEFVVHTYSVYIYIHVHVPWRLGDHRLMWNPLIWIPLEQELKLARLKEVSLELIS